MHAQPPRTLKSLLKQYGQELIDDPRRTEALLRDLCGQHTREIFVLVNAQKQRVPSDLLAAPAWMPRQATYSRLSKLLQTKLALTEETPTIKPYDEAAWALLEDTRTTPVETSLTMLDVLHDRWVRLLRAMAPTDFERRLNHPENGMMILDQLLALYAWHGPHHIAHVTKLREREGWA